MRENCSIYRAQSARACLFPVSLLCTCNLKLSGYDLGWHNHSTTASSAKSLWLYISGHYPGQNTKEVTYTDEQNRSLNKTPTEVDKLLKEDLMGMFTNIQALWKKNTQPSQTKYKRNHKKSQENKVIELNKHSRGNRNQMVSMRIELRSSKKSRGMTFTSWGGGWSRRKGKNSYLRRY